jgi:hypothetical protein
MEIQSIFFIKDYEIEVLPISLNEEELDFFFKEVHNGGHPPLTKKAISLALKETKISHPYIPNKCERIDSFKEAVKKWAVAKDYSNEQADYAREMLRLAKRRNQLAITVDFAWDSKWDPSIFILASRKFAEFLFPDKRTHLY